MLLSGDTWPRGRGPWGGGRGLCGWHTLLPSGSDLLVLSRVPGALDTVQLDGAAGAGQRLGRGSGWPSDGQRTGKDTEKPERPLRNQQDRRGRSAQPEEFLSLLLAGSASASPQPRSSLSPPAPRGLLAGGGDLDPGRVQCQLSAVPGARDKPGRCKWPLSGPPCLFPREWPLLDAGKSPCRPGGSETYSPCGFFPF